MKIENKIELFDKIQQDATKADALYIPAPYWRTYSERIGQHIRSRGLQNFRNDYNLTKGYIMAGVHELVMHPNPKVKYILDIAAKIPLINKLISYYDRRLGYFKMKTIESYKNYYDALVQLDDRVKEIKDDGIGNPVMLEDRAGVSLPLIYALNYYLILNEVIDLSTIKRIKEVGAGYGGLAEVILKAHFESINSYIIYDIPPLCYVSSQYLKAVFGETNVGDYMDYQDGNIKKVMVLPSWLYADGNNSDLLINTASFQEMDEEKITNYIEKSNSENIFCVTLTKGHKKNANGQVNPIELDDVIRIINDCDFMAANIIIDEPLRTITSFMDLKFYSTIVAKKCP
jgi:putative sugar O-methyltransferase